MKKVELTLSIEVNEETGAVHVSSMLPGDGDVAVIIGQLKNLADGLMHKVKQKLDRDYPDVDREEIAGILKSLTIEDLK